MPWFIIEFRPLRYLLLVLVALRGAANGDWQALVILSVCALLLWWRPLLGAVRDVQEGLYQARVWLSGHGAGYSGSARLACGAGCARWMAGTIWRS